MIEENLIGTRIVAQTEPGTMEETPEAVGANAAAGDSSFGAEVSREGE